MTRRAAPRDWCTAGLTLLREEGNGAVTIDRLCAAVKKTKGSFYHHFHDSDAFRVALLDCWEEELTDEFIHAAEQESDPSRQAALLDRKVLGLDHHLDIAVRAWAQSDDRARAALERVDRRRINYIAQLYQAAGHKEPRLLAELEYTAFVGAQHRGALRQWARAARLSRVLRMALDRTGR